VFGLLQVLPLKLREHVNKEKVLNEASTFKIPELPPPAAAKQADQSKCFTCKKKIGLLGNHCKSCDCYYCNSHRLPEDHKCESDYVEVAKNAIKKNNPNITAPKIEQI
jgi:predicted nucleic acid binding AN1-type Zn finger protein